MNDSSVIRERIIRAVAEHPGCLIEELVLVCPELTWNQVFLHVDHLSRTGALRLSRRGPATYTVHPAEVRPTQPAA